MEKIPASVGWLWVKQGFALYRKQPAEMSTLFLAYIFMVLLTVMVPLIGQLLLVISIPVFSMAFMQACVNIEQGKRVYPNLLLTGFRSPAFWTLVQLGVLYLIATILSIAASALVDDGKLWQLVTGQTTLTAQSAQDPKLQISIVFFTFAYILATLPLWFAAPLIAWKNMSLIKAVFFSVFSVWRAIKAFAFYGLIWFAIRMFLGVILTPIVGLIIGNTLAAIFFWLPLSILVTVVMYCSFYVTYTHLFNQPDLPQNTDPA